MKRPSRPTKKLRFTPTNRFALNSADSRLTDDAINELENLLKLRNPVERFPKPPSAKDVKDLNVLIVSSRQLKNQIKTMNPYVAREIDQADRCFRASIIEQLETLEKIIETKAKAKLGRPTKNVEWIFPLLMYVMKKYGLDEPKRRGGKFPVILAQVLLALDLQDFPDNGELLSTQDLIKNNWSAIQDAWNNAYVK